MKRVFQAISPVSLSGTAFAAEKVSGNSDVWGVVIFVIAFLVIYGAVRIASGD